MSILLQGVGNGANTNLSNLTRTGKSNLAKYVSESDDVATRADRFATSSSDVLIDSDAPVSANMVLLTSNTTSARWYDIQNLITGDPIDSLNELVDVQLSSVANNDILTYETSTSLWKNKPQSNINSDNITEGSTNLFISTNELTKLNNVILDSSSIQLSNGSSLCDILINGLGGLELNSDATGPLVHNTAIVPMTVDGISPDATGDIEYKDANLEFKNKVITYQNNTNIDVNSVAGLIYDEVPITVADHDIWQYNITTDHMELLPAPVQDPYPFVDLLDVKITSPSANDLIYYDSGNQKYENAQPDSLNIVDKTTSQVLTNKDITDSSNLVRASQIKSFKFVETGLENLGDQLVVTSLLPNECQFQPQHVEELSGLSDVMVVNPLGNYSESLMYNSVNQKWENKDLVTDLNYVKTTTTQTLENKTISYSNNNAINSNILRDVIVTGIPATGDVLKATSSISATWQSETGGSVSLNDLTNVTIVSVQNSQLLTYDNAISKWTNKPLVTTQIPDLSSSYLTLTTIQNSSGKTFTSCTIDSVTNDVSANKINSVSVSGTAPSANQVLTAINSTSASWQTPAAGTNTLSALSDVNIISASDLQVLSYDNSSSKWINYSQPAFITNDSADNLSNKTISYLNNIISVDSLRGTQISNNPTAIGQVLTSTSGIGATCNWQAIPAQTVSGLSDVLLTSLTNNDFLIYQASGSKWINTSGNNYVTLTGGQILTNKVIDDVSNTIRCDKIKTVTISNTAPSGAGQFLVSQSANTASWSNIVDSTTIYADDVDTTKRMQFQLSEITTGTTRAITIPNKDGTLAMSSDLTNIQINNIINQPSLQLQSGATASPITTNYSDVSYPACFKTSSLSTNQQIVVGVNTNSSPAGNLTSLINLTQTTTNYLTSGTQTRINIEFINSFQCSYVSFYNSGAVSSNFILYIHAFDTGQTSTSINASPPGGTLMAQIPYLNPNIGDTVINITGIKIAKYYSFQLVGTAGGVMGFKRLNFYNTTGTPTALVRNTDYTLSVDSTTGFPIFTKTVATSEEVTMNLVNIALEQMYDRIYPVIRDNSTISLSSNASTIRFNVSDPSNIYELFANSDNFEIRKRIPTSTSLFKIGSLASNQYTILGIQFFMSNILPNTRAKFIKSTSATSALWSNINMTDLLDYETGITPTTNDIMTYNGSKWQASTSIILGMNNSVKLEESAIDTLKISSTTQLYGTTFNYSALLWTISMNNNRVRMIGNNDNSGGNISLDLDSSNNNVYTISRNAGLNTIAYDARTSNVQTCRAKNYWSTSVAEITANTTVAIDGPSHYVSRTVNNLVLSLPISSLVEAFYSGVGYSFSVSTYNAINLDVNTNAADPTARINGDATSVTVPQRKYRQVKYIGVIAGVPQWVVEN